ncbi:MAG: transposase, partial [Desulfovibrionaceae bacterium]
MPDATRRGPRETLGRARSGAVDGTPASRQRARYYRDHVPEPLPGEKAAACGQADAMAFLRPWLWPGGERRCPRCGDDTIYDLSAGRLRCAQCRYTFTELSGRWINSGGLDAADWVFLCRLFVLGRSAHQAAQIMGLSYNAAFRAITAMRFAILAGGIDAAHLFGPETELRQYVRNKRIRAMPRTAQLRVSPVFGIIERGGWVFADLIPGYQRETLYHLHLSFHLPLGRAGNIVYTGRYRQYQTLVSCTDGPGGWGLSHPPRQPEVDVDPSPFWAYALERLKLFKGVT